MKIVALTGGSGSGKSSVLNGLREQFSGEVTILSLDDYYRPKSELPKDSQGETNFDVPEVINYEDLVRDMRSLMAGNVVELDTYTYNKSAMISGATLYFWFSGFVKTLLASGTSSLMSCP